MITNPVAQPGSEVRVGTEGLGSRGGDGGEASRSQIYTYSLHLSNAFLRRFVAKFVLHLPYPPKNNNF